MRNIVTQLQEAFWDFYNTQAVLNHLRTDEEVYLCNLTQPCAAKASSWLKGLRANPEDEDWEFRFSLKPQNLEPIQVPRVNFAIDPKIQFVYTL